MSIKLERWMRSLVHGRYGRWIMLGLLIAILSGFTVMSEIGDWLRALMFGGGAPSKSDVAGSFSVAFRGVELADEMSTHPLDKANLNRFRRNPRQAKLTEDLSNRRRTRSRSVRSSCQTRLWKPRSD